MRSKKRRKINDNSDDNEEEKDDNKEVERLVQKKKSSKKRKNNKKSDDNNRSDGLGNDRKKKKKKSDGEEEDIGKKKKKKKTTMPASVVARSKAPSPTDCWAVGLLECNIKDPYTTVLAKTTNPSIMKLIVRNNFFRKEGLHVKVLEQLKADNTEWSGATDREKALFLFFKGQQRWTVDGTPVYLGRC